MRNRPGVIVLHPYVAAGRAIELRGDTTDIQCFEKVFLEQEYRSPMDLSSPKLIVDAGAKIGMATIFFAASFPEARIVVIEPEAENFRLLERNCAGLPNVTLKQAALWPDAGMLELFNYTDGAWTFAVKSGNGKSAVDAVTIPMLLAELGSTRIDLLKLDIEGSERELFAEQACKSWLPQVSCVVAETHDRYRPGASRAFYSAIASRPFHQEVRGENIFIRFMD
jgi:FkbM family methyltransferase